MRTTRSIKMQKLYSESSISDIADAIRAKGGTGTFTVGEMAQAIEDLPSGGGEWTTAGIASGTEPSGASALPAEATYKFGESVTVAADATAPGYTFSGWSETGTFEMPAEDVKITGSFTANEDTAYKVEHYTEKLDGTYELKDIENLTGTTDTTATEIGRAHV